MITNLVFFFCKVANNSESTDRQSRTIGSRNNSFSFLLIEWVTLHARLNRVVDGDTLVVRGTDSENRSRYRVRLLYIDAPELAQPFGRNSTRELQRKFASIGSPLLTFKVRANDNFGRKLAVVFIGDFNINLWMVSRGLAVCYKRRCPRAYKAAMRRARSLRLGLWRAEHRVNPWTWRKQHRRRPNWL